MGIEIVYLLFLIVHTITDLRERQIYVMVLALEAFTGMFFLIYGGQTERITAVSFLPGLFCLGLGRVSGEKIGYGDGWMILLSGLYLSPGQMAAQLLWASLAACLYAAGLLMTKKLSGKGEVAFAPFFLIGYLGGVLHGPW